MKIVPSYFPEDGESSERKVYSLLDQLEPAGEWMAFHSQNISEYHRKKKWCELDFIILGPRGVLALEVKGGRVSCKDGVWTGKNRRGEVHKKNESPFEQAKTGCYALEEALKVHLGWDSIRGTLFGWGVVFTDIPFNLELAEASPEIIADSGTVQSSKRFFSYINKLYDFWERQCSFPVGHTPASRIHQYAKFLRPNFDMAPRLGGIVAEAEKDFVRMTEGQYNFLDCTEESDRILCKGGAGTGKTFVAVECARREAATGNSVLFVVESRIFAEYVRQQIEHPAIKIYDFLALASESFKTKFDTLVVDEGQDLMNCQAMDLFESLLAGGLEKGSWRWFMDPNNQAGILGEFDQEAFDILTSYPHTPLLLKRNVRNTKPIATQTQLITGADIGVAENIGGGSAPKICIVESSKDEASKLQLELQTLLNKEEVKPRDIAILSFQNFNGSSIQLLTSKLLQYIAELASDGKNLFSEDHEIIFSSVRNFKGLERKFVYVIDLDAADPIDEDLAQLYVALTRANFGLWLALPKELQESFDQAKLNNAATLLANQP
ncbi:NERD domain-containing protein [bacterium]|nr:NERD domain-containing protein [bacterium]